MVPAEWIEHLIRETDCESFKVILALARFGGLRREECLRMRWEDVDLVKGRMLVRSTKTPPVRCCPIFPELRPSLLRAKEMAPAGAETLQTRYRPGSNPCTTLKKLITRVGLETWPKPLQNLRASRETELLAKYPVKDATAWIANSPRVAFEHDAMVTNEAFARAVAEGASLDTPESTPI